MFIRKKRNKSGVISVQVIDKSTGSYKVLQTIGSSSNEAEISILWNRGKQWIKDYIGQYELDLFSQKSSFNSFLEGIRSINIAGPNLLLESIFNSIGFNQIQDALFRYLVFSRLLYPTSKLKTVDYLQKYHSISVSEDSLYRYMDKLYNHQKEEVQQISYRHTLKVLDNQINVVFYDVTTLYFETDMEDELRKTGFSKDGKHRNPQIVLGLLVSMDGYPLAYDIFEGKKFEGHTMLPIIDSFKSKYQLEKLVVVADSGLMSKDNIEELQEKCYEFILGARIKNEPQPMKDKILSLDLKTGESRVISKSDGIRLIISYSESRAKKDKANREKGIQKLEKQIRSGKLTKANINNRGYNKYLKMEGDISISIDHNKFDQDARWDGLKGYLTNSSLSKEDIISNYKHLWMIEKAFRINKHDLRIRPIYHHKQQRIEAHICISFTAYKVYKELERMLKEKKSSLSPEKAIEIAKTIYAINVEMPPNKEIQSRVLLLNQEQKTLAGMFGFIS